METYDQRDDLTGDDDLSAYRDRAKAMLNEIAGQAKQALADAGIDLDLFFLVPSSGDALVTFGTPGDPPDDQWRRVGEIVSSIVHQTVGVDHTRCRAVTCATTDAVAGNEYPSGASSVFWPDGHLPMPIPTPTSPAGVDPR